MFLGEQRAEMVRAATAVAAGRLPSGDASIQHHHVHTVAGQPSLRRQSAGAGADDDNRGAAHSLAASSSGRSVEV